ncbi:glycosyltransferase [uncultured Algoriphagus sp.]|uniref:glycosyltransferase n=1 Tax=uncultured Algoriphagus sp. TaxID=417365 RepID=UPI002591CE68|nr:glycosyltransferase [uncultured Algoriphagus sp.]
MKKPSVIFIAGTLGQGGAEKQLFLLSRSLKKREHEVEVISLTKGEYWEHELRLLGIKVHNIPRNISRWEKFKAIKRLVKQSLPDVVYSFHFYTSFYAGLLRFYFNGLKTIGSIRNNGKSEVKENGIWSWLHMHSCHKIIGNNYDGINYVNKALKVPRRKLFFLSNAVETSLDAEKNNISTEAPLKIVFIGRLVRQKDPEMLLEIASILKEKNIPFQLDIIGDGPMKESLNKKIINKQLQQNAFLLGKIDKASQHLPSYQILLSTSLYEGTPNVILEALLAKVYPVVRNYNGIQTLFNDIGEEYCHLIFRNSIEAVEIIIKISQDPNQFKILKNRGRDYVMNNFSEETQYRSFSNMI